jgi:DNA-3-methyladenine glycosylase
MQERRGREAPTEIASGPGRLAEALGVTRSEHDGVDLTRGSLRFEAGEEVAAEQVAVTGRIGLSEGGDHLLRFLDRDSSHVSRSLADDPDHGLADVELRKR